MDDALHNGEHLQLRYMTRFSCIGPDCEDHCCYGWRVDINEEGYKRLIAAAAFSAKPIRSRIQAAIKVTAPKKKKERARYSIRHGDDQYCPFLDERGLCDLHANFGHAILPDVCAIYPRKMKRVGDHLEHSATASCPEVSRQLLMHADGADVVPLDLATVDRLSVQTGLDTRDLRPYYRTLVTVRDFVIELLGHDTHTLQERLFLMVWFAKRTADILQKQRLHADLGPVHREMALLRDAKVRAEICRRFEAVEAPAALALMVVRAIVRPNAKGAIRPKWNSLVMGTINSYAHLRTLIPDSTDAADHDRAAANDRGTQTLMTINEVWDEYRERRARVRARLGDRIDQYLRNYTLHQWFHRMATEESDVMLYVLRLLSQQAATKFLLYSDPRVHAALADETLDDDGLVAAMDAVAVDIHYQLSRHIEHGPLITYLVKMLETAQLASLAGAVYLIRF